MKSLLGAVPRSQGAVSLSTQINREVFLFLFLIKGRHAPVSTGKKTNKKETTTTQQNAATVPDDPPALFFSSQVSSSPLRWRRGPP